MRWALACFDVYGVPRQSVGTFKAFAAVAELPTRVATPATCVAALASKGDSEVRILLSAMNGKPAAHELTLSVRGLPWDGETTVAEARWTRRWR
jgi:hypothetical protein